MADFLLPALATAGTLLLLVAGGAHLAHPGTLRAALDRQDLVRRNLRRPLSIVLGATELAMGLAAGATLVTAQGTVPTGLLMAGLGAGFTGFLVNLLTLRPGAPCGCGDETDGGAGAADVGRSGLVLAGGLALASGGAGRLADLAGPDRATALLAGLAIAVTVDIAARANRPLVPVVPS